VAITLGTSTGLTQNLTTNEEDKLMCFRPAAASKPIDCPTCGKKVVVIGGVKQKKCPHCGTELIQNNEETSNPAKKE